MTLPERKRPARPLGKARGATKPAAAAQSADDDKPAEGSRKSKRRGKS